MKQSNTASVENTCMREQPRVDSSPLRRALRAHFEAYGGLTEPRLELAAVALEQDVPQRDDL